jgi:hypothetical protein
VLVDPGLDTISPVPICTDTTVYLDNTGRFTIDSSFVIQGMSDNCGVSYTLLSRSIFSIESKISVDDCMLEIYNLNGTLLLYRTLTRGKADLNRSLLIIYSYLKLSAGLVTDSLYV